MLGELDQTNSSEVDMESRKRCLASPGNVYYLQITREAVFLIAKVFVLPDSIARLVINVYNETLESIR